MEAKCENHCPNCNAGDSDIDWGHIDISDGITKQGATCKKCGTEFTEYCDVKYNGTEYDPPDFDNPYFLDMTNDCSKKQYEICLDITEEITERIRTIAINMSSIENYEHSRNFNIACIRMLRLARVGVGDADTDKQITNVFKRQIIELGGIFEAEAAIEANIFYGELHQE